MKSVTLCVAVLLLTMIFFVSCDEKPVPYGDEPPDTPVLANDDIVFPPGTYTYRAKVIEEGQPRWPEVQETEVSVQAYGGIIYIRYRDFIETKAGERRNNIITLFARNASKQCDLLQVDYQAIGAPDDFSIAWDGHEYGGINAQDKTSSKILLQIDIMDDMRPGEYPFTIELECEGEVFNELPCTMSVID